MQALVKRCSDLQLKGFTPQNLCNLLGGGSLKGGGCCWAAVVVTCSRSCVCVCSVCVDPRPRHCAVPPSGCLPGDVRGRFLGVDDTHQASGHRHRRERYVACVLIIRIDQRGASFDKVPIRTCTGLAALGYRPPEAALEAVDRRCLALGLLSFTPHDLACLIQGATTRR
jgi:hypothetical protein